MSFQIVINDEDTITESKMMQYRMIPDRMIPQTVKDEPRHVQHAFSTIRVTFNEMTNKLYGVDVRPLVLNS